MDAKPPSNSFLLAAWEKHEKIAMHFNELILKIRIQALGALAAIVTIGGVLLKTVPTSSQAPWELLAAVSAALLFFWIAICLLDFLYYNRLLRGAVDCLLVLEKAINSEQEIKFNMSHKIQDAVLGHSPDKGRYWGPWLFYSIVGIVLLAGTIYFSIAWLDH